MTDETVETETILVKFEGHSDPNNATAEITFAGDPNRNAIAIGGQGEVTMEELATLTGRGYRLTPVDDGLDGLLRGDLDEKATELGLDPKDYKTKDDVIAAIREAQAQPSAAAAEALPPSATVGTAGVPPTTSGAGSAAGPGGAGGSGDAGGGPATSGTASTGGGA